MAGSSLKPPPDSWGVQLDPSISWVSGFVCPRCKRSLDIYGPNITVIGWENGFVPSAKDRLLERSDFAGILIFECQCSKRFWAHMDGLSLSLLRFRIDDGLSPAGWPKDEEGYAL